MVIFKFTKWLAAAFVVIIASLEAYQLATEDTSLTSAFANAFFNNNLHEIRTDELFRSGEMTTDELGAVVQAHKIKTVFDLRLTPKPVGEGDIPEVLALKKLHTTYVHVPLKGSKEMALDQVKQLLTEIDKAETPALIHCTSGTHRSGVVAAIWMMERDNLPYDVAIEQLSAKFGFFKAERQLKSMVEGHPTIDNILWRYEHANEQKPISFRAWVNAGMPG